MEECELGTELDTWYMDPLLTQMARYTNEYCIFNVIRDTDER